MNLEAHGFEVVAHGRLGNVTNIYDETAERAYGLARQVDRPDAQAIFLSGVGMPTIAVLEMLERDLGKLVISSAAAMMWNALRVSKINAPISGYGSLLGGFSSVSSRPDAMIDDRGDKACASKNS
jgi:maleate cis-trans isomerase